EDLLLQETHKEGLQLEIAVKKAKLLEHDFFPLHALGVLVFMKLIQNVLFHFLARDKAFLYLVLYLQLAVVTGKGKNLVYGTEKLFFLLRSDLGVLLRRRVLGEAPNGKSQQVRCCHGTA